MAVRTEVRPQLLDWARERSGISRRSLAKRFPKLREWESGKANPSLRDVEEFARVTHTPVGFMFLPEPPNEPVPIPDFRTMAHTELSRPSADLLDTVFTSQQHQEWYRTYAELSADSTLAFVGSLTLDTEVVDAAATIRHSLNFEIAERGSTWRDAFDHLVDSAEQAGVLVRVSSIVGLNTKRKLDPQEFRGFALADPVAPLIFVNGSDTKAAQLFTLIHELGHVWLGQTALSDERLDSTPDNRAERWCNQVAAEVLVPLDDLKAHYAGSYATAELDRLARVFKASTLVILRRIHDAGYMKFDAFHVAYTAELKRVIEKLRGRPTGGGSFYNTQPRRLSRRFTRAVLVSALDGRTLYRDAFRMLGVKKQATFDGLVKRLVVK